MWLSRVLAVLIAVMFFAPPASAHAGLVSSDPPDGTVLTQEPTQVVLEFNEVLLEQTVSIAIRDAQDQVVSAAAAQASGATVIVPWPAGLPDDTYRVAYRVVSADGHPVTGEITVALNIAGDPSVEVAPSASNSGGAPAWLIGLLVVAIAATIVIIVLARRSRS
jgi:methionine-rich copper-binding protein CopC